MIAKCHIQQERYDEALKEIAAAERVYGGTDSFWDAHSHMNRGIVYARQGNTRKAEIELETLMRSSERQNRRVAISGILFALVRTNEGMDWLEAAATAREPHVTALRTAPDFDLVSSHSRFQMLLKRIGLAD